MEIITVARCSRRHCHHDHSLYIYIYIYIQRRSRQYTTMHCSFGPLYTYYQFAGAAWSVFIGCRCKHISESKIYRFNRKWRIFFAPGMGLKLLFCLLRPHSLCIYIAPYGVTCVEQCRKINFSFS